MKLRNPALLLPLAFAVVVVLCAVAGRKTAASAETLEPQVKCLLNQFEIPLLPLPGSSDIPARAKVLLGDESISLTSRITLLYWASNPYALEIAEPKSEIEAIIRDAAQTELSALWKLYLARSLSRLGFFCYLKQDPAFSQQCLNEADHLLAEAISEEPEQAALRLERVATAYRLWHYGKRTEKGIMPAALPAYPGYDDVLMRISEYLDAPLNQHPAAPPYVEWLDDPLQCKWPAVQGLIGWMMPMRDSVVRKVAENAADSGDGRILLLLLNFALKYGDSIPEGHSALREAAQCAYAAVTPFLEKAEETENAEIAELLDYFLWDVKQFGDDVGEFVEKKTDEKIKGQSDFDYIVTSQFGSVMVHRMIEDEREVKQAFQPRFNDLVDRMVSEWEAHLAGPHE